MTDPRKPRPSELALAACKRAKKALREKFTTPDAAADAVGVSRQGLWKWDKVPPLRVPVVSKLTGISMHELRPDLPDLFPPR